MPAAAAGDLPRDNEFGSDVLHMSAAEIDQYLTSDMPATQGRLWVPQRVSGRSHQPSSAAGQGHHVSTPSSIIIHGNAHRSMELEHPGTDRSVPEGLPGYGTTLPATDDTARLLRSHQKISRVAIPIAFIFGSTFVVALCYNNPPKSRAGVQQLATMDMPSGFACPNFLCPHSGTCAIKASDCPEGNPFLTAKSAYNDLIQCGPSDICTCKSPNSPLKCSDGSGVQLMLHSWSSKLSGGCSHVLCPRSGECVTNPALCSEGDPFVNKHGPYFTEAMVAKAVISERAALKPKLARDTKGRPDSSQELATSKKGVAKAVVAKGGEEKAGSVASLRAEAEESVSMERRGGKDTAAK